MTNLKFENIMVSNNFVVAGLPDYVQNNKDLLVKNFGLVGGTTRQRISIMTGIKGSAALEYFEVDPVFQDGRECVFNADGTVTLSERIIDTAMIKVDMDICPRTLRRKYAEYLIRINATEQDLPFEQYIVDGVITEINKKQEILMWQGDTTLTTDNVRKWYNGFLKLAETEADVVDVAIAAGTSAYDAILQVYEAMTEETLDRGGEIYVSPAFYRKFMMEMVAKNFFHYPGAVEAAPAEFFLPGSDVKVVKMYGLTGTNKILGTFPKNLYYGCDMEGDDEDIDLWYSQDDRVYKMEVLWNAGVQIAYPDQVVLATIAEQSAQD